MGYTMPQTVLGSGSSGSSGDHFVGDARLLTVSVQTSTGSASNVTISLSNADGFQAAIPAASYSVATVLTKSGIFTVDPGARWMKVERADIAISATSNTTVLLNRTLQR